MGDETFNFDAEFSLLDVGATSSLLRSGSIRPAVLLFEPTTGVEAIALDWETDEGAGRAFEDARRYARDRAPAAYAVIAEMSRADGGVQFHLPHGPSEPGGQSLAIAMTAADGCTRGLIYPIRRSAGRISFGQPVATDEETTDWCPLGNPWANPFCQGDVVRFRQRDRAVDPSTPLWHAIVELTRLRIHEDQPNAEEYMSFLDDLRNGVFAVEGRSAGDPLHVVLRPRTLYNPLGTLCVAASRLLMAEQSTARVDRVAGT
ncbi:MAG TPA: hypothetical protein VLH79_06615 [Chthonomonadales bacterium]|nr:hypothetical protein [Chthonomonadales bacterium]